MYFKTKKHLKKQLLSHYSLNYLDYLYFKAAETTISMAT
jgi:hypothetical protein